VYFSVSFGFVCEYVSQEIGWEDYYYYSRDIFRFPYEDQIEELFIRNGSILCNVFLTPHFQLSINFLCKIATFFSKARCSLFVLKVPLSSNQPINQSISQSVSQSVSLSDGDGMS